MDVHPRDTGRDSPAQSLLYIMAPYGLGSSVSLGGAELMQTSIGAWLIWHVNALCGNRDMVISTLFSLCSCSASPHKVPGKTLTQSCC